MESLLSLAFDNLSSYDGGKIRKGLRQVEGMLAQICLAAPESASSNRMSQSTRRNLYADHTGDATDRKQLAELPDDPAFLEFFKLQEGFQWNVALRLVNCLDRLMGKSNDGQNDLLILSCLDLIQGVMLLHPPSCTLFSRELYMNHLLDLLEPVNCPAIQSATLHTLVCALISTPSNTRTFEALDGLLTVTSLFKSRSTSRDVKLKLVEFLYFYLMPETPSIRRVDCTGSVPALAVLQQRESKLVGAFKGRQRCDSVALGVYKSTEEKQELLGRYLGSVEDLVADLRESAPFGGEIY